MKWLPLPKIVHATATYPYKPLSLPPKQKSRPTTASSLSLPPPSPSNTDSSSIHSSFPSPLLPEDPIDPLDLIPHVPIEVGDELFIFEQNGQWYRGYVLRPTESGAQPNTALIGVFPSNHVHVKGYLDGEADLDDVMQETTAKLHTIALDVVDVDPSTDTAVLFSAMSMPRSTSDPNLAYTLPTSDDVFVSNGEDSSSAPITRVTSLGTDMLRTRMYRQPPPPLPLARFDETTAVGATEPLVDEISSCIRSWNCKLYSYLQDRRYGVFNTIKDQINYLFQARRQLLVQTLSQEELARLRKEVVHRMVTVNMWQDLSMIIRNPEQGYLIDVNNTPLTRLYRMHFEYAQNEKAFAPSAAASAAAGGSGGSGASGTNLPTSPMSPLMMPASASSVPFDSSLPSFSLLSNNMSSTSPTSKTTPLSPTLKPSTTAKSGKFYHIFFDFKACVAHFCQPGEFTELYFSLYNKAEGTFLTEEFYIILNYNGMPRDESKIGKLRTLFTDLSSHDLNENLYLVCRIVRNGAMKVLEGSEKGPSATGGSHTSMFFGGNGSGVGDAPANNNRSTVAYWEAAKTATQPTLQQLMGQPSGSQQQWPASQSLRRPFGCAVLSFGALLQTAVTSSGATSSSSVTVPFTAASAAHTLAAAAAAASQKDLPPSEHFMPIFVPSSESTFATLHEDIIAENTKEYEKHPRAEMLCVYLRMFHGELDTVVRSKPALLQGVPIASRLGFPDVVFPGDVRNELYIRLAAGDFSQFGRAKNVQIMACVRDNVTGDVIEGAIVAGAGTAPVTFWESMVYYHEPKPTWGEIFKIRIEDPARWERCHVFVTVRHRTASKVSGGVAGGGSGGGGAIAAVYGTASGGAGTSSVVTISPTTSPSSSINNLDKIGSSPPPVPPKDNGISNLPMAIGSTPSAAAATNTSDKMLAFGFLPLFLPPYHRSFVTDGSHMLVLYKYDKALAHPSVYMNTTWTHRPAPQPNHQQPASISYTHLRNGGGSFSSINSAGTSSDHAIVFPNTMVTSMGKLITLRDNVTVKTFLCSTKYTQNDILLKLLNWERTLETEKDGEEELRNVLDKFTFVGEVEIVKFLQDIFGALFGILGSSRNPRGELDDLVFRALVTILGIIQDRRFHNFRPVLDVYVEEHFCRKDLLPTFVAGSTVAPKVSSVRSEVIHQHLLRSLTRLCSNPAAVDKAKELRASIKVWEYLFRFVVRSREAQRRRETEDKRLVNDAIFKQELRSVLVLIEGMMSPELPSSVVGTQTLALQRFAEMLADLARVFTSEEMVEIVCRFVDACKAVKGKLVGFKLCMILGIVRGPVFQGWRSRVRLVESLVVWVEEWIGSYEEVTKEDVAKEDVAKEDVASKKTGVGMTKTQWHEFLRLSITVLAEVLDKVRAQHAAAAGEEILDDESEQTKITSSILTLLPRLLNAYTDLHEATAELARAPPPQIPPAPTVINTTASTSSKLSREKSLSTGGSGLSNAAPAPPPVATVAALACSPGIVFPSAYPFPVAATAKLQQPIGVSTALTTGLADLATILLELFYLTPKRQLTMYLYRQFSVVGRDAFEQFVVKLCRVSSAIVLGGKDYAQNVESAAGPVVEAAGVYPKSWLNLNVIAHQILVCHMIVPLAEVLERKVFVPEVYVPTMDDEDEDENEDEEPENGKVDGDAEKREQEKKKATEIAKQRASAQQLWEAFFDMLLRILASPVLDIEAFLPQRQRAVWKLVGDLRGAVGAKVLTRMWEVISRVVKEEEEESIDGFEGDEDAGTERFVDASEEVTTAEEDEEKEKERQEEERRQKEEKEKEEEEKKEKKEGEEEEEDEEEKEKKEDKDKEVNATEVDDEAKTLGERDDAENDEGKKVSAYQLELIPSVIGLLCELSLSPHDRLRLSAISIVHTMVLAQCEAYGSQDRIRRLEIQAMDRLIMSDNKGDEVARKRLILESLALWEREAMELDPVVLRRSRESLDSLSKFIELLLYVRSLPQDNEYNDERIMATLKLMRFIQMIEREIVYIKYVHQLVQLQFESHNYVEAALTLRFHTDLLEWTPDDELDAIAELDFPAQSSFARKEKLYYQMLDYFVQGKAWEMCIAVCKELASEYEHTTYNYSKLADILQKQAEFFNNIMKKERYFTEYFRVGFYGKGFPTSLRNKQFIYRGLEWEKISSFVERIQSRHPNAKLLPPKSAPPVTEEQLRSLDGSNSGQYIQVTAVVPEPDREHSPLFVNAQVPDAVRSYYEWNEVNTFSFSKPIIRPQSTISSDGATTTKPENEFLNLWTEKTVLTCEDSFPTILRRSEVIKVQVVELSPIENAVIAMENKNREFLALERKFGGYLSQLKSMQGGGSVNVNPFSMALNGAVDAPVNGGVPMYKNAFLTDEFLVANPQKAGWVDRLRVAIDGQVSWERMNILA